MLSQKKDLEKKLIGAVDVTWKEIHLLGKMGERKKWIPPVFQTIS